MPLYCVEVNILGVYLHRYKSYCITHVSFNLYGMCDQGGLAHQTSWSLDTEHPPASCQESPEPESDSSLLPSLSSRETMSGG